MNISIKKSDDNLVAYIIEIDVHNKCVKLECFQLFKTIDFPYNDKIVTSNGEQLASLRSRLILRIQFRKSSFDLV